MAWGLKPTNRAAPKAVCAGRKLQRGASGPRVRALQYLLRAKDYDLVTDGIFGVSTERALRKFQLKNRLQVDGTVGWQSWEALTPRLRRGARGHAVRSLQTLLDLQGYPVALDGIFGVATQRAVLKLQNAIGLLGADGKVDDGEWCYISGGHLDGE